MGTLQERMDFDSQSGHELISDSVAVPSAMRECLCPPIPEIEVAAKYLKEAVGAHLAGDRDRAEQLVRMADISAIREWTESIWGKNSCYVQLRSVVGAPARIPRSAWVGARDASVQEKMAIVKRDHFRCRFCGIPVIRDVVRRKLQKLYPAALPWGRKNGLQHAAFQAMWAQFDHVLPFSRGGATSLENLVLTCAPCNYGRMEHTLEEVGLLDPRLRTCTNEEWDGLEAVLQKN